MLTHRGAAGDAVDTGGWLSLPPPQPVPGPARRHRVAVAVPARNEAGEIAGCLRALDAAAARVPGCAVVVLVLVNNSRDATADRARGTTLGHCRIRVVEARFPPARAHAGRARGRALDLAAAWLEDAHAWGGRKDADRGTLMSTDADSRVAPDWIAANLHELERGADAVAGAIGLRGAERIEVAPARDREWRLAGLHARLRTLIDPLPHDPWPTHIWAWGASLAVTLSAYRAVGGVPPVPLAEDRALADRLERAGFAVRRSFLPVVWTSPRAQGRAPGGFADLLSAYRAGKPVPCDAALEPTAVWARRLAWRARLRRRHGAGERLLCPAGARRLRLGARGRLRLWWRGRGACGFGLLWGAVERDARSLRRRRLQPGELEREIGRAERLVSLLEGAARRGGSPPPAPPR